MPSVTRDSKFQVFPKNNGGLATRATPLVIESESKSALLSPDMRNVEFFPIGAVAKRNGILQEGDALSAGTIGFSQTSSGVAITANSSSAGDVYIAQKITVGGSGVSISSHSFYAGGRGGTPTVTSITARVYVYTDSSGPGSIFASPSETTNIAVTAGVNPSIYTISFGTPISLSASTSYWIVVKFSGGVNTWTLDTKGNGTGPARAKGSAALPTWVNLACDDLYYVTYLYSTASSTNGLYDYRSGASTQNIVASTGGTIYYKAGSFPLSGSWTSLTTGLGSGQNVLYDFRTLKDYLFSFDYATNPGRVWDGAAAYTIKLGYQAAFALADNGSAGTMGDGVYKVMAVTQLDSGGYRASMGTVTMAGGGTQQIAVTSVSMDGTGATDFGFDIQATATKWFMTDAGGSTYYKIPTGNLSTAANPMANNTTTFNITATTGLTTANTLLDEYTLDQDYFTAQVAAPQGKFLEVWQNFLVASGTSANPSRVWFSSLGEPMIWSTVGGIEGNYIDFDPADGDQITGVHAYNGNLYVTKRHAVYIVEYTGVAQSPFIWRKLNSTFGCLSHWSFAETEQGLVWMSERGPVICYGTSVALIKAAEEFLNLFDPNDTGRFNLSAMIYTTAGHNQTKRQVYWGVSSTSATTRDLTLVYDYGQGCFWLNSVSANYYATITDANYFTSVWAGDYSANVYKLDTGTDDDGAVISFYWYTPWLSVGSPFVWKRFQHLDVSGAVQSTGTLYADIFVDFSTTAVKTLSFDMTDARFKKGLRVPLGVRGKAVQVKFYESTTAPARIDSFGIGWQEDTRNA